MKQITKIEPAASRKAAAKLRVAAYCRVSTGMDEQLISLEAQKAHYEELISSNPEWKFAGLYYDEGISGTNKEKRPALQQLIADCEAGKVNRILTKSLSRFARNTTDCLDMVRKLLDLGVTIFFEKENLDTGSMESELMLSIMSSLAESESVSISQNSKWGVRHRFENGTYKISYAPYGYSVSDGVFSINEQEAEWVRWVFSEALSGRSITSIARELNEKKVPSRRSGKWTPTTIRAMLTNEKYIGDCLFQKTFSDFRFHRRKNYGELDQFYAEDHHEAIISREDFEAVGKLIEQRTKEKSIKKGGSHYRKKYPFSKKLICDECGSAFKRHINNTGSISYPVWACTGHLADSRGCSMRSIKETDLECAFTTMMNKLIFAKKEVLDALLDGIRSETHRTNMLRIDEIDEKLEKNAERREILVTLMTRGYLEPALFTSESNELSSEADALAEEKEKLMGVIVGGIQKTEALTELIRFVGHAEPSTDFNGELVERFLETATVSSREEVIFHLKCSLSLTERINVE